MLDCGITTYILMIIWLFSFLMIIGTLNTGRSSGRTTLIVSTSITAFFRFVPTEYIYEVVNNFLGTVYIISPFAVTCILSAVVIGYICLYRYLCRYPDPPPKSKEPGHTE